MPAIRTLLVGDNVDFIEGLRAWLECEPEIELLGIARSGDDALLGVARLAPDAVLIEASLHRPNGFELCRRLRSAVDSLRIVLMSFSESETLRREAWAAGADELVCTSDVAVTLMPVLREIVHAGRPPRPRSRRRGPAPDLEGPGG